MSQNMHEVRLSPNITDHDISYRVKKAIKWLEGNDKVKCTVLFKGRHIKFVDRGEQVLRKFAEASGGDYEVFPKMNGRLMYCIIRPKKK